mmetsp:Transcript_27894/g.69949  ORF Transcript_27894/g.69949 Transcript_27894/m.69949 type:complete len:277 (+) Transcript_27894:108-938(+)
MSSATAQLSRTASSRSCRWSRSTPLTSSVAMAPSASAASCRTMGCSPGRDKTSFRASAVADCCICPRTNAISWRNSALLSANPDTSAWMASLLPSLRRANMARYRWNRDREVSSSCACSEATGSPPTGGAGSTDRYAASGPRSSVASLPLITQSMRSTAIWQVSATSTASSFTNCSTMARHSGVAIAPSASPASCLTMLFSSLFSSTRLRMGTAECCPIWPMAYAISCFSSADSLPKPRASASTACAVPMFLRVYTMRYFSVMDTAGFSRSFPMDS